jgi:hypothetical protein
VPNFPRYSHLMQFRSTPRRRDSLLKKIQRPPIRFACMFTIRWCRPRGLSGVASPKKKGGPMRKIAFQVLVALLSAAAAAGEGAARAGSATSAFPSTSGLRRGRH